MKIQKFKIDGYKSLKNIDVTALATINMLYGYNNSGKSNILKALELIFKKKSDPGSSQVRVRGEQGDSGMELGSFSKGIIEDTTFLFNLLDKKPKVEFEVTIVLQKSEYQSIFNEAYEDFARLYFVGNSHDSIPSIIKGEIVPLDAKTAEFNVTSVLVNGNSILELNSNKERAYLQFIAAAKPAEPIYGQGYELVQNFLDYFDDAVLLLDNDRYFGTEYEGDVKFDDFTTKTFKQWFYKMYLNPSLFPTFLELVDFIKKFKVNVDPKNIELKSCEANSPIAKMGVGFSKSDLNEINIMFDSSNKRLPLDSFGTGIHQILYILSKIFVSRAKLILIEELELNLSPRYQGELLKHLNKLIGSKLDQVFFTTHSKYFSFRNDFSIYELSLDSSGNSKCKKVTSPSKVFFTARALD